MWQSIDPQDALRRGLLRIHADDSSPCGENIEPYGFVIPKGRCLVVTDLAYYSALTMPQAAGNLTRVMLATSTFSPTASRKG
ncbi:MAG TPA: hypothetical protein VGY54_24710 [Polyangiaceae bacterium]|nr:hypothetical protein [Polyangiaceae bacterium]